MLNLVFFTSGHKNSCFCSVLPEKVLHSAHASVSAQVLAVP